MEIFKLVCEALAGLVILFALIGLVVFGIWEPFHRNEAQWNDAMQFARRTGGHYEPGAIIYPDGRVIHLDQIQGEFADELG